MGFVSSVLGTLIANVSKAATQLQRPEEYALMDEEIAQLANDDKKLFDTGDHTQKNVHTDAEAVHQESV